MSQIGTFGRNGEVSLQATIPGGPSPTVDPDEPKKVPCSNPAECAEYDEMVARNRWDEWNCAAWRRNGSGGKVVYANYAREHWKAWITNATGAHPPPGSFLTGFKPSPPPTFVPGSVTQYPGEES